MTLPYFCDIGKIIFSLKIDFKIKCHREIDMKHESRKKVSAVGAPDRKIIIAKALVGQYKQFLLDKNFWQYLKTILISKNVLRMGVQKTSIQKTYEMYIRFDSINVDFLSSNTQFDWLEISLVNDKSDKHTIHDSYNVELAAKYIKSIKAQQTKKKKSIDNNSIDNIMQKHYLYKKFAAWNCYDCSVAPMTSYIHNPIYQELII